MIVLKQAIVAKPIHDKLWNYCWSDVGGSVYSEMYNKLTGILHVRDLIPRAKKRSVS